MKRIKDKLFQKEEKPNLIIEKKYGSVKAIKIIKTGLLIYYESDFLVIYNLENNECLYDNRVKRGDADYLYISNRTVKITNDNGNIIISTNNNIYEVFVCSGEEYNGMERLTKKLDQNIILRADFSSKFSLIDRTGNTIFEGKHNNWVSDGVLIGEYLITVGYDGIVKKWNIKQKQYSGCYILKSGWITVVRNKGNDIYLGTQYGQVYKMSLDVVKKNNGNIGAIWNIYKIRQHIYTVSEDGKIVRYSKELDYINEIQCSFGWINAMDEFENKLVVVTSLGEIILVDQTLKTYEVILRIDMWINNLIIFRNIACLITAEGSIVGIDLYSYQFTTTSISCYQLIDIVYDNKNDLYIIIDIEGNIFFVDKKYNVIKKLDVPNCHFTSLCINPLKNSLYISTLEGEVLSMSLFDGYIKRSKLSSGRIWKVAYSPKFNKIVVITTLRNIMLIDDEINFVLNEKKGNNLWTTCSLIDDKIYVGDDKGVVCKCEFSEQNNLLRKIEKRKTHEKKLPYGEEKEGTIIYVDNSDLNSIIRRERDETILKKCGISYDIVDLENEQAIKEFVIAKSGWNRFPQILFNNHFIASGSVLPHMYETGALKRLINNLLNWHSYG